MKSNDEKKLRRKKERKEKASRNSVQMNNAK